MLGKLILVLLQVAASWIVAPVIRGAIPVAGAYDIFLYAIIFAIIVYLVGVLGAQVLRDVGMPPSTAALTTSLIVALIVAALIAFVPQLSHLISGSTISHRGLVLAGAIVGYWLRK